MTRALSRLERIRRRSEYLRVQRHGVRIRGRFLTVFLLPARDIARLGIIATRRLGGAVQRNRAKRRVRELFRLNKDRVTGPSMDVVVMPRPGCGGLPFDRLESDYLAALRRHAALR